MLIECRAKQPAELIVVEGKHAANAVSLVRNRSNQAVLAMQGKVPNIAKTGLERSIQNSDHVRLLLDALTATSNLAGLADHKYDRVLVLSDPDVDGLHAALLLVCLVAEIRPQLVENEKLLICRSPLYRITSSSAADERFAYSKIELQRHRAKAKVSPQVQQFKGIASIPAELLEKLCIDPVSRIVKVVSLPDSIALRKQLEQPFKRR